MIHVGVLGHVDSGKTSLSRLLSEVVSTAALDKNPQSRARGITLDVGFSSFMRGDRRVALVDCPGHASLIKTVVGGASTLDGCLLVVDCVKLVQQQTIECMSLCEIIFKSRIASSVVVVLNKIDALEGPEEVQNKVRELGALLSKTALKDCRIVPTSCVGDEAATSVFRERVVEACDFESGKDEAPNAPFYLVVDHCFQLKGKGTVLTGTVMSGSCAVGDEVYFPRKKLTRRVKSMQSFKTSVNSIRAGDRAALLVTDLKSDAIERDIVTSGDPNSFVEHHGGFWAVVRKAKYSSSSPILAGSEMHVSVGYDTFMCTIKYLCGSEHSKLLIEHLETPVENLLDDIQPLSFLSAKTLKTGGPTKGGPFAQLGYFSFKQSDKVLVSPSTQCTVIGSRLDDASSNGKSRIVLWGSLLYPTEGRKIDVELYTLKKKVGKIDRLINSTEFVGKKLFHSAADVESFKGFSLRNEKNEKLGRIVGSFGKTGKFKCDSGKEGVKQGQDVLMVFKKAVGKNGRIFQ